LLSWLAVSSAVAAPPELPTSIRVGVSGDYAPFSVMPEMPGAAASEPSGFDADVARRFAREAGLQIEWVRFRWPGLAGDLEAERFDVAMSGVTWTPERATAGYLTRAVAATGACSLGAPTPKRVGVNRGGALERWARGHFAAAEIVAVDRNRSLPELLARGDVDAIVTDRFELASFRRDGFEEHCEPPTERKVYWVAPARARDLGPRLDDWIARNEPAIAELRARWLGGALPRSEADHLLDLVARRLALMPAVAGAKAARGLPLVDPKREAEVLAAVRARARAAQLDPDSVEAFFVLQIELGTRVQSRATAAVADAPALDLATALRPAISGIGDRIVASLAILAPLAPAALDAADWAPLGPWLEPGERAALRDALLAVRRQP